MLSVLFLLVFRIQAIVGTDDDFHRSFYENHFTIGDFQDRNAVKSPERKWPNGTIPYKFGDDLIERDRAAVLNAMDIFRKETCIKFVLKRSNHTEFIIFRKSDNGCGTIVGYRGNNTEGVDVLLTDGCLKISAAIQHELLHVIGLWHEQSRPDRDDFVDIYWENIEKNHEHNFRKISNDSAETFDFPYDFDSLMHYPKNAFAKKGANYTITSKKDPERKLGQMDKPTYYDLEKVRRMYDCE